MGYRVTAQEIANFLNEELIGEDIIIADVKPIDEVEKGSFSFSKNKNITVSFASLILLPKGISHNKDITYSYICVNNPRLEFGKILKEFFCKTEIKFIHPSVFIGNNCDISSDVSIGINCTIGDNVKIGKGTIINNNIVIYDNTIIGKNCYIKSGSIIGEDGFGFAFEDNGTPIRIPHIGNVVISNNVEIGAKNTISRATLGTTLIGDFVKTDDQVHIAHNCKIGKNTIITACAEISGSVIIGENCWLGPNSSIMQKVCIGNNVTIGIGAVITKDIIKNKKIMGLEGLDLKNLLRLKKRIEYGK